MHRFEYIKFFWNLNDNKTPIVIFYVIDVENKRYSKRMTEIFSNRSAIPFVEEGFKFVSEAPLPTLKEINLEPEFYT